MQVHTKGVKRYNWCAFCACYFFMSKTTRKKKGEEDEMAITVRVKQENRERWLRLTETKLTQSALVNELIKRFGDQFLVCYHQEVGQLVPDPQRNLSEPEAN